MAETEKEQENPFNLTKAIADAESVKKWGGHDDKNIPNEEIIDLFIQVAVQHDDAIWGMSRNARIIKLREEMLKRMGGADDAKHCRQPTTHIVRSHCSNCNKYASTWLEMYKTKDLAVSNEVMVVKVPPHICKVGD